MQQYNTPAMTNLPLRLRFTDARSYALITTLVLFGIWMPRLFHLFNLAGPTFLPMHIFVLVAGLIGGWRAGLMVGLITPLFSFAVSGMPSGIILPQVTLELATYGLVAGWARENWHWGIARSLVAAMFAGRLVLGLALLLIYLIIGTSQSPLGIAAGPVTALWEALRQGGPGILLQLALLPWFVRWLGAYLGDGSR